jgi:uncharacterized protein YhfF
VNADRGETYWRSYLDTLPADSPVRDEQYVAEGWGDSPEMADELGALISAGTKTATCSSLWEYEAEGDPLPQTGLKTIVLDGNGDPLCIVETTEVEVRPYDEVDAQFAYEEGEGDRSLEYWREAHRRFFSRTLPNIGKEPAANVPLVCERFRVTYRYQRPGQRPPFRPKHTRTGILRRIACQRDNRVGVLGREKFRRYVTEEERERFLPSLLREEGLIEIEQKIRACRDPHPEQFLDALLKDRSEEK